MDIMLIVPEIAPYSRSGEIGDICAALPKGLRSVGHKVTVVAPLWSGIDPTARTLARRLSGVEVELGGERFACTIHDGRTTGGVELVFVGHTELFGGASDCARADLRAALVFCEAAAQLAVNRGTPPDVVHAYGFFAAAALPLCASRLSGAARVLSLDDVTRTGALEGRDLPLPDAVHELAGGAQGSLLQAGIGAAQRVIARSQTEAAALLDADAQGLRNVLEAKLTGIAGGLDAARWNPLTDPLLPARYDAVNAAGKERCKGTLQLERELPVDAGVPLVSCVLTTPAAAEQLARVLPALLHNALELVVVGTEPGPAGAGSLRPVRMEAESDLRAQYPERLAFVAADAGGERTLHRAIAAADLLLLPGGELELTLAGQRYGALPIGPGGQLISDAVVDCDASLSTGTGFLFEPGDADDMLAATQRALGSYTKRAAFVALRTRVMQLDLSWERSARHYEHVYKTLVELNQSR